MFSNQSIHLLSAPELTDVATTLQKWLALQNGGSSAPAISVGDSYGGGIVAYILQSGDPGYDANKIQGLIVPPTDQGMAAWDASIHTQTTATATAIGSGKSNTDIIIAAVGAGTYAAQLCNDLVLNGQSDWFLPSKNELLKVFANKGVLGMFNTLNTFYWASTDGNYTNMATVVDFTNGSTTTYAKAGSYNVRAMRYFSVSLISDTDKANFRTFMTTPSIDRKLFLAMLSGNIVSVTNLFSRQQYV